MSSTAVNSTPLDPRVLSEDSPVRDKMWVRIDELKPGTAEESLHVTLSFRLDPNYPSENEVIKTFCTPEDDTLAVTYVVTDLPLRTERKAVAESLDKIYQSEIGKVLRSEQLKLDEIQLKQVLVGPARHGSYIFKHLFWDLEPDNYSPDDRPMVREAVRSALSRPRVICVDSPVPLFPWSLLYQGTFDPENLSTLDACNFWGYRHEIQQQLPGTSPHIHLPQNLQIVTAICSEVDEGRHNLPDHPFCELTDKIEAVETVSELGNKLASFDASCFYFYGHAGHREPATPTESWLELRHSKLYVSELDGNYKAPSFKHELVVAFLNGCRMNPLNGWDENTVIGFLCLKSRNRLCCVAPVASVPITFAAEFARRFWQRFLLNRQHIGSSLLEARLDLLREEQNPLGLLYSLFGRVDTQIG